MIILFWPQIEEIKFQKKKFKSAKISPFYIRKNLFRKFFSFIVFCLKKREFHQASSSILYLYFLKLWRKILI